MLGRIATILLFAFLSLSINGCSNKTEQKASAQTCPGVQPPDWVNDSFVGISRVTASGNRSDQRKIALQRAIVDLLMTKGNVTGSAVISMEKNLSVKNEDEILRKHFQENSVMNVTYKAMKYDIKVTDIWRDPCTKELYVKIEEN